MPNMELLRKHLLREGHLNKPELMEIVAQAVEIMRKYLVGSRIWEGNRVYSRLTNYLDFREGAQCDLDKRAGHYCRRYPWVILRHDSYVRKGR